MTRSVRLAIVCTHPVQYYVPVFKQLGNEPNLVVRLFYGWRGATAACFDPGFNATFQWDIDLLNGYDHVFVNNVSVNPSSSHFSGIDLPTLADEIFAWDATIVLVYGWCYKAHLSLLRKLSKRIPILFRGDSTLLDDVRPFRTLIRRLVLRWVYWHVDVVLYVGTNNRNYFLTHGVHDKRLVFAPHSIDNEWFASRSRNAAERLRQNLKIDSNHVVVLFAGKLEPKKGPDLLVEAFLRLSHPQLELIIVGSGELEESLRQRANGKIHFVGFQNQMAMPEMYASSDLVILPSRGPGETWGLAINEAMACAKSVAASDRVGASIDLIQPGVNGWIFKANCSHAIERTLAEAAALGRTGLTKQGQESARLISTWSIKEQVRGIMRGINLATNQKLKSTS